MSEHYALRMQGEIDQYRRKLTVIEHHINTITNYCMSDKYCGKMEDEYIHKNDVILRLNELLSTVRSGYKIGDEELSEYGITQQEVEEF